MAENEAVPVSVEIPDTECDCEACVVRRVIFGALEQDNQTNQREAGVVITALAQIAGVLISGAPTVAIKIDLFKSMVETVAQHSGGAVEMEATDLTQGWSQKLN